MTVRTITRYYLCSECGGQLTDFTGELTCTACGLIHGPSFKQEISNHHEVAWETLPNAQEWGKQDQRRKAMHAAMVSTGVEIPAESFIERCIELVKTEKPDFYYNAPALGIAAVILHARINRQPLSFKKLTSNLSKRSLRAVRALIPYLRDGLQVDYHLPQPVDHVPGILEKLGLPQEAIARATELAPLVKEHSVRIAVRPAIAAVVAAHVVLRYLNGNRRPHSLKAIARLEEMSYESVKDYFRKSARSRLPHIYAVFDEYSSKKAWRT